MSCPQERKREPDASKILGRDAHYPNERTVIAKLQENYRTASEAFDDARTKLEDAIQDFENANKAFENGLKSDKAAYDAEDFLRFLFQDASRLDDRYKEIDELNKHAVQLRKKAPTT